MGVNILEVLREKQLSRTKKSIAASEAHEKRVSAQAAVTSALLNGQLVDGGKHMEEYALRDCFIREMELYTRQPNRAYAHQPFNPRGLALWRRVAKAWKASGVPMDMFIKAQFTFFHKAYGRAPETKDLTTDGAVVRAASTKVENVRSGSIQAEINTSDLFRHCEKHMADIMRAQKLTREEVYRNLVIPGIVSFPDAYLSADSVWRRVKNG